MSESPRAPVAGWYADPSGRHQHRFWDGTSWTWRVADTGVESSDPPVASREPARRGAFTARWPVAVGLAVVVGVAVGVAAYLAVHKEPSKSRTQHASTTSTTPTTGGARSVPGAASAPGAGSFTFDLDRGDVRVQVVHLRAGETAVVGWHVVRGQADMRAGISAPTVDRLADHGFVSGAQRASALQHAASLLANLPDQSKTPSPTVEDPTVHLDRFHGVVLGRPDTLVAPVEGDYAVIAAGTQRSTRVELTIAVRAEPSVRNDLSASEYDQLIAGSFRDSVNRFVTAFCAANPSKDRGACDRLQHDDDNWPVTGADPAPLPPFVTMFGSGAAGGAAAGSNRTPGSAPAAGMGGSGSSPDSRSGTKAPGGSSVPGSLSSPP